MATYGFQSTSLWTSTLAAVTNDRNAEHQERLRSAFLKARETTRTLLGELGGSVPEYTVHDLTHADALWETASLLIGSEVSLNPVEGFVLGMAFLLHDAAMGLAAYQGGPAEVLGQDGWKDLVCEIFRNQQNRWPTDEELADPPADVVTAATSAAIREAHARQAGVLVETPWVAADGTAHFLLDDVQLRDWCGPLLADLVESHWWSVEKVSTYFRRGLGSPPWLPDWPLDPLKLACLLRLADATQIDARRAPTLLFLIRQPAAESGLHWRFQQYVHRPQLRGDRMTYTCSRPFDEVDAPAWWLALDYLSSVDREMRKVDDLLHDLNRPRFTARGVANVGTPARFAELFPVRGWRPVDVDVQVSDVPALVSALGGAQLYGRQPEVAVRELIQNAHDAVMARRTLEPGFVGSIDVVLAEDDDGWTLTVRDDGIGMDEDMLVGGLMDFGRSGWRTRMVRTKFAGLMSGGFRPKGSFGIGFFSTFMLGDDVEVLTRRFDLAYTDARRLTFAGLASRSLMTKLDSGARVPSGTTVTVRLLVHPLDRHGLLGGTIDGRLQRLVQWLTPESEVAVRTVEPGNTTLVPPFSLAAAESEAVFDRLYPEVNEPDPTLSRFRHELRAEFVASATPIIDRSGRRLGMGLLGSPLARWYEPLFYGVTTIGGFAADRWSFFTGYMEARPGRASRDQAELGPDDPTLRAWLQSQDEALRSTGRFTAKRQLEHADVFIRAGIRLSSAHQVAITSGGLTAVDEIESWASSFADIFVCSGWPLTWSARRTSLGVYNSRSGARVDLPEGWILPVRSGVRQPLDQALDDRRDERFASARFDRPITWQRSWWSYSDDVMGLLLTRVGTAWGCSIEKLLAPVAARGWSDTADLPDGRAALEPIGGMWLRRPAN